MIWASTGQRRFIVRCARRACQGYQVCARLAGSWHVGVRWTLVPECAGTSHRRGGTCRRWGGGEAELDQFDIVEGLKLKGGPLIEVLNGVSLHGGLVVSCPAKSAVSAQFVCAALPAHWRAVRLPGYVQFDNDTVFQGPHQHRDVIGSVMRVCLSLDVTPVFAPPRESRFQASIESYNGAVASQGVGPFCPWLTRCAPSALSEVCERPSPAQRRAP